MPVQKTKKCPVCRGFGYCDDGSLCPACQGSGEIDHGKKSLPNPCRLDEKTA